MTALEKHCDSRGAPPAPRVNPCVNDVAAAPVTPLPRLLQGTGTPTPTPLVHAGLAVSLSLTVPFPSAAPTSIASAYLQVALTAFAELQNVSQSGTNDSRWTSAVAGFASIVSSGLGIAVSVLDPIILGGGVQLYAPGWPSPSSLPSSSYSATRSAPAASSSDSNSQLGAIVGGTIGGVLAILLLIGGFEIMMRVERSKRRAQHRAAVYNEFKHATDVERTANPTASATAIAARAAARTQAAVAAGLPNADEREAASAASSAGSGTGLTPAPPRARRREGGGGSVAATGTPPTHDSAAHIASLQAFNRNKPVMPHAPAAPLTAPRTGRAGVGTAAGTADRITGSAAAAARHRREEATAGPTPLASFAPSLARRSGVTMASRRKSTAAGFGSSSSAAMVNTRTALSPLHGLPQGRPDASKRLGEDFDVIHPARRSTSKTRSPSANVGGADSDTPTPGDSDT